MTTNPVYILLLPTHPLSTFKSLFLSLPHTHTSDGIRNMNEKGIEDNHKRHKPNTRCSLKKRQLKF